MIIKDMDDKMIASWIIILNDLKEFATGELPTQVRSAAFENRLAVRQGTMPQIQKLASQKI
jgi:hypothetical protein